MAVYLFLKKHEEELDPTLTALLSRLEQTHFDVMSIEEFERLAELYRSGVDVFTEKR